jgi:anti-anti-sigma regulatory factor
VTKAVDALLPPPGVGRIYLVSGALAIGGYFFLPSDVQSILFVMIAASSGVAIFVGARLHLTEGRLPWYLFAAGQLAFAIGDGIFGVYEIGLGREPPFPSVADPIYLAAYPLIILAIFLLIRGHRAVEGHFAVVDATIIAVGFGLVQWVFLVEPQIGGHASPIEDLALIAYPAVDALLLGALARFFLAPAWRTRAYLYVMVSIVLLLMADEVYAAGPDLYIGGDWVDALWLGSYILWGAGALDPSMRNLSRTTEGDPGLSWGRLALMTGALLSAPTILVIEIARENRLEAFAVFAAAAVLAVLVLGRGLGMDAYVFERERIIRLQQSAIRTLSAPILEIRREILMVPVVGRIDPERIGVLAKHLTSSIRSTHARVVVLDLTNAGTLHRGAATDLARMVNTAARDGTEFIMTGASTTVARALSSEGHAHLEDDVGSALARAEELLGHGLVRD